MSLSTIFRSFRNGANPGYNQYCRESRTQHGDACGIEPRTSLRSLVSKVKKKKKIKKKIVVSLICFYIDNV